MKIVELQGKRIMLLDKFVALGIQDPYININLTELIFEYESGLTDTFNITSNINYVITTGETWIGVNHTSGVGVLTITVEMLSENSGLVNREGIITIQNTEFSITKIVTIIQNFDVQPLLYIMTEGGEFEGELV